MTKEEREKFLSRMYDLGLSETQALAELCSEEKKLAAVKSEKNRCIDMCRKHIKTLCVNAITTKDNNNCAIDKQCISACDALRLVINLMRNGT